MTPLTRLLREGKIGRLCKSGALIIALIGIANTLLQLYSLWEMYTSAMGNGQEPYDTYNTLILPRLSNVLQEFASIVFYVVVLYAAGVVFNARVKPPESESGNEDAADDALALVSLDEELL